MALTQLVSSRTELRLAHSPAAKYSPPEGAYYDPVLHPDGIINLSTAENSLLNDQLLEYLNNPRDPLFYSQHLKYRSTLLKSQLPHLDDLLIKYVNENFDPQTLVTRQTSVTGPGVGALLASLIWGLTDVGDGVLLSAPYYGSCAIRQYIFRVTSTTPFDLDDYIRDITYPSQAIPVFATIPPTIDPFSLNALPLLRHRILSCREEGVVIKVVMLCNPHNPIPKCYPVETIQGYISIANEFNLHLVVDEVFALSTFAELSSTQSSEAPPTPFQSILSILPSLPPTIHFLTSPTKHLGCSALKIAILVSNNTAIIQHVGRAMWATPISGASEALLSRILADNAFMKDMRAKDRHQVAQAWDILKKWCIFHGIGYITPSATSFTLVDFASILHCLASPEEINDDAVPDTAHLMDRAVSAMISAGVFLKPTNNLTGVGIAPVDSIPTRFRFIFAHKKEILLMALQRIEQAFGLNRFSLDV